MKHPTPLLKVLSTHLILIALPGLGFSQNSSTPGPLIGYSTPQSIGLEWSLVGDDDHDATCALSFRVQGEPLWTVVEPLFRVDYTPPNPQGGLHDPFNGFSGSVLFLESNTPYEVKVELVDPDGGSETRETVVTTGAIPTKPTAPTEFHVSPGNGGGSGTAGDPFLGIDTAQTQAAPDTVFLLHTGTYSGFAPDGEIQLDASGSSGHYVVWQAAGDGPVVFNDPVRIAGDFIWLEGVHVRGNVGVDDEYGLRTYNDPESVVISRNRFTDFYYSIALNHGGESWTIIDNTIIGDKDVINTPEGSPSFGGEGIELEHTSGHTVAYNRISRVADGISYPLKNVDIFANEIFDVTDDGLEPDYGYANIRIWGNRISNARHAGISFQPMNGGPWYILRNQVAAGNEGLKLRESSRALIAHNIFVGWEGVQAFGSERLLNFQSNNNLWITVEDRYAWENGVGGVSTWRTLLDYDGFDWGNYLYAFKWGSNERYADLAEFTAATGLEANGVHVDRHTCFTTFDIPLAPPQSMPFQSMTLEPDCPAVDAGVPLAGINEGFTGTAPDLGPFERGLPLPDYGPRRVEMFSDGFESGDTSGWSAASL